MQKVFLHLGHTNFNPNLLGGGELGCSSKPAYGLWASPFNVKGAYTWEHFAPFAFNGSRPTSRENAFAFTVKGKILEIYSMDDIQPFLKNHHIIPDFLVIDFDEIKSAGYSGVELCNACGLHNMIFYPWDVESIVVWDANSIEPIPMEQAYIARIRADAMDDTDAPYKAAIMAVIAEHQ